MTAKLPFEPTRGLVLVAPVDCEYQDPFAAFHTYTTPLDPMTARLPFCVPPPDPAGPVGPAIPCGPVAPTAPAAPAEPAAPCGPVGPVAPAAPAEPAVPCG